MINEIGRTERQDGVIVSTIKPLFMAYYGTYETAISFDNQETWHTVEGYETEEQAREGHKKYENMSIEELEKIDWID